MSVQAITWAFKQEIEDSPAKFLLVALANYADPDGRSFPRIRTLANDTSQSMRTIHRKIALLSEEGFIRVHRRINSDGSFRSSIYHLAIKGRFSTVDEVADDDCPDFYDPDAGSPPPSPEVRRGTASVSGLIKEPSHIEPSPEPPSQGKASTGGTCAQARMREDIQTTGEHNRLDCGAREYLSAHGRL